MAALKSWFSNAVQGKFGMEGLSCCGTRKPEDGEVGDLRLSREAFKGDARAMERLIAEGSNINEKDLDHNTPLHWAAVRGHVEALKLLLNGADVNARNKDQDTPLHWSCSGGHAQVVDLLVKAKADIMSANVDGTTPLHFAMADGHVRVVYYRR